MKKISFSLNRFLFENEMSLNIVKKIILTKFNIKLIQI